MLDWQQVIGVPITAAVIGYIGWFLRTRYEAARREAERLHATRRKTYMAILEPYILLFASLKDPEAQEKVLNLITSVDHRRAIFELNLMGADHVVRAFNEFSQLGFHASDSKPSENIIVCWGKVLVAIRKDLGNKGTKLKAIDMLRSQITDIDQFIK